MKKQVSKTKYTSEDLGECKQQYRANFALLVDSVGTEKHKEYVKIENELYKKEVEIQKALGVYIHDPCPIHTAIYCHSCSGYYRVVYRLVNGKKRRKSVMCKSGDSGATRCILKSTKDLFSILEKGGGV